METLEIKNHLSQLELENRRLQINYAKLRKINLEKLDIIKRSEDYAMIGNEDDEEAQKKHFKKASVCEYRLKLTRVSSDSKCRSTKSTGTLIRRIERSRG